VHRLNRTFGHDAHKVAVVECWQQKRYVEASGQAAQSLPADMHAEIINWNLQSWSKGVYYLQIVSNQKKDGKVW
jgi:hypothetical protein